MKPSRLQPHYYSAETRRDLDTLQKLLNEYHPDTVLCGHGGPITATAARHRLRVLLN